MKVTMLLADAAQTAEGKLYVLGGGWAITGPDPSPSAVAMYIEVPWDQANMRHDWQLELVTSDGDPVTLRDPADRDVPVALNGQFEVGRPAGLTPGAAIGVSLAVNLGPLPLPPGGRYEWRLTIGPESREDWRLAFSTRPA
ncbi:MAG: DUF6941 family protein [Thermoleophilaceae bacterium]